MYRILPMVVVLICHQPLSLVNPVFSYSEDLLENTDLELFENQSRELQSSPHLKGQRGSPGRDGAKGERGYRGMPGPPGSPGPPVSMNMFDNDRYANYPLSNSIGFVGPQGPRGERGYEGPKGDPGNRGEVGPSGLDGLPGPEGPPGMSGEPGILGPHGLTGQPGAKGERGEPGACPQMRHQRAKDEQLLAYDLDGLQDEPCDWTHLLGNLNASLGTKGAPGPPGPPGATSVVKADGTVMTVYGEKGAKGDRGRRGKKGWPGSSGLPGEVGPAGFPGMPGQPGDGGPKGEDGIGMQGPKGDAGEPGLPGIVRGEDGTVYIPGPRGYKGDIGAPGMPGLDGRPGDFGPHGPEGPRGYQGEPGEKGECLVTDGSAMVGLPGLPGPPGRPGQGLVGATGSPGMPGPQGLPGPPGPPGQPNSGFGYSSNEDTMISPSVRSYFEQSNRDAILRGPPGLPGQPGPPGPPSQITNNEVSQSIVVPGAVTFKDLATLRKMSKISPVGTLAFVLDEEVLLVRVNAGWHYVHLGSLIKAPIIAPSFATTELPYKLPMDLQTLRDNSPVEQKKLRMVALNHPTTGKLGGIRGADFTCYRQGRAANLRGTFRAFLGSRYQKLESLVRAQDRKLPIVNLKGQVLFNSWNDLISSGRSHLQVAPLLYSFDGRNVLSGPSWPNKVIWHGSHHVGSRLGDAHCNGWDSSDRNRMGLGSSLRAGRLFGQERHRCDQQMVVLCVEITSDVRPRSTERI